jgi:hypothetical protein
VSDKEIQLWLWTVTDPLTGKHRQTSYRMTEADARARFGDDARKVPGSLEVRKLNPGGTNQLRSATKDEAEARSKLRKHLRAFDQA